MENQCFATNRAGLQCGKRAMLGGTVCASHGGKAPQVKAAAARKLAAAAAEQAVTTYGLPRDVDPHAALIEELHRTAGHVAWLGLKISDLEDDAFLTEAGPWTALYHIERRHFADVARSCIAAGIEERRVRIAEEQGQLLATAIRGILTELGVNDRPEVPGVVRRHLMLVAGDG